jgi:hypothetical protein
MAPYANFLGRQVTVQYRVGDVLLVASGTFVGDCGRSIFLEQHLELAGKRNYFRWEIPYPYIHRIAESSAVEAVVNAPLEEELPQENARAAAAGASAGSSPSGAHVPGLAPLPRPKPI